jgi:hypothetical protein
MLTLRSSLVAGVLVVGALRGQVPAHGTIMFLTPSNPEYQVVQLGDAVHISDRSRYYLRSLDGGRTWPLLPGLLPLGVVTDFACGPGLAIAAGLDEEPSRPFIVRSTDGGATWLGPVNVSPGAYHYTTSPVRVHVDGANVVCVWPGFGQVWVSRSTTAGASWQSTPTSLSGATGYVASVQVLAEGPSIHVFWNDTYTSTGLQQASVNGGATWLASPRVGPAAWSLLARSGNDFYTLGGGATLRQSHDGGLTWTSGAIPGMQSCTTVACAGQLVVVGGSTTLPSGFAHVLNVSPDGGTTWHALPWTASSSASIGLRVHAVAGDAYAHFRTANPATDVVLHSGDLGATWRVLQNGVRAFAPGPRRNIHVLRSQGASTWYDAVFVGTGYTTKGTGIAGTGGVAPQLRLDGLPHLGATTSIAVDGAVGGALGALGFAFAAPAATSLGPATIWLQGPLVLATLAANGAPGAPGAGSATLPLAIPANPSLVGANLTAQALLLDAGAAAGFTVTNAIEAWMR